MMKNLWQPIETAPKVPFEYLIGYDQTTAQDHADPQAGVCIISWMPAEDADEDYPAQEAHWLVQPISEGLDCIISETNVTHWMHLPSAPTAN
jgi:hypothetical protein